MDASAFLELQEAWLHADHQLGSPYFLSGLHEFSNEEPYSLQAPVLGLEDSDAYGLDSYVNEIEEGLQSMQSSEEDALMMDRPLLDYVNEMLMDEAMEDHILVPQDCVAYQSIVDGLYNIIGEHSPSIQSSSTSNDTVDINDMVSDPSVWMPPLSNSNGLTNDDGFSGDTMSVTSSHIHSNDSMSFTSTHIHDNPGKPSKTSYSPGIVAGYDSLEQILGDMLATEELHPTTPDPATPPMSNVQAEPFDRHVSFVKNRDLDVEADYERLYLNKNQMPVQERVSADGRLTVAAEIQHNGHRENNRHSSRKGRSRVKGKKGQAEGVPKQNIDTMNKNLGVGVALDLKELPLSCAQAVSVGNATRAFTTLQQLRRSGASADGSGLHRVIHYFCEALEVRIQGTGSRAYSDAAYNNRPSLATLLKAFRTGINLIPMFKFSHYFANQSILKAAEGATHLHIVDYGIYYGLQWPCLINALADRKEGPPKLVITGIEYPQPGENPAEGVEAIGYRLSEYAKTYNVPFEFHAVAACNWDEVIPIRNNTNNGEVLVVNCMHRLHHVLDECINASENKSTSCPREKLLEKMCKLNPHLFVLAVINASHNSPFFVSRFREALNYYCSKFDMVDTTWDSSPDRMVLEKDCFYRDILNVVACEGFERVERPEPYKQTQARILRAGFEHIPIVPSVLARSRVHVQNYYHKDFNVDHDSNHWMLVSWKGRNSEAISAWKPSARSRGTCN